MNVITLCGSNRFAIGQELDRQINLFLSEPSNSRSGIERLDGVSLSDQEDPSELLKKLTSPSLFAENKLVIIRDLSRNEALSQQLVELLSEGAKTKSSADSTTIIIVDPDIDGRSKLYKLLKSTIDFKEFSEVKAPALTQWVKQYVQSLSGHIEHSAAVHLVDQVGPDQQRLASEIDKLIAYDKQISEATIDLLVEPSIDSTTFDLAEAVFTRDHKRATKLYREQRQRRVEPQLIIGSLAWQLHLLLLVKAAGEDLSSDQIALDSGISAWSISKARRLATNISSRDLITAVDKLLEIDQKGKSARGYNSDDALQLYLLSV